VLLDGLTLGCLFGKNFRNTVGRVMFDAISQQKMLHHTLNT